MSNVASGWVNVASATGLSLGRVPASLREPDMEPAVCAVSSWNDATGMYVESGTIHNLGVISSVFGFANRQNFVRQWQKSPLLQQVVGRYEENGRRIWSAYTESLDYFVSEYHRKAKYVQVEPLRRNWPSK